MTDPNRPVTGYPYPAPNPNGNPPPPPLSYASGPPTGYYNNNQQQPYYNNQQNNYHPDPYAPQRATFLRRILGFMIAGVLIIGTILFIIWLIFRPTIPEFRVDSLSVSNFNISSSPSTLSGVFDLHFTVYNPNKKLTASYDQITARLYYDPDFIVQNTLPPFTQTTKNATALQAVFSALNSYVGGHAVDEMNKERANGGKVWFAVRMIMRVNLKSGGWRARSRWLRVYCRGLNVGLGGSNSTNGTLIGGPQRCRAGF